MSADPSRDGGGRSGPGDDPAPGNPGGVLDQTTRRTGVATVSAATTAIVEEAASATQPALEEHFRVQSAAGNGCSSTSTRRAISSLSIEIRTGPSGPGLNKKRQVSVSIFLNDANGGVEGESYGGGTLVLWVTEVVRRHRVRSPSESEEAFVGFARLVPRGQASHQWPALQHCDVVLLDDERLRPGQADDQPQRGATTSTRRCTEAGQEAAAHTLSCFLDEPPSELIPRRRITATRRLALTASWSSTEVALRAPRRPSPEIRQHSPADGPARPAGVDRGPGTGVWAPWVRGDWVEVLSPCGWASLLRHLGLMSTPNAGQSVCSCRWQRTGAPTSVEGICPMLAQFQTQGYAVVRDVVHPVHTALRRYYRALVAEGSYPGATTRSRSDTAYTVSR
jgi:hypothetical protein